MRAWLADLATMVAATLIVAFGLEVVFGFPSWLAVAGGVAVATWLRG